MKNKIIYIDADDVLWPLLPNWINALNRKYNLSVRLEDCHAWQMTDLFPMLTLSLIYSEIHQELFWENISVAKDAVNYTKMLYEEGYDLYVATASSRDTFRVKSKIVTSSLPWISPEKVICIYNKQLLSGFAMIDDGVHNLKGGNYNKILFTSQHNLSLQKEELSRLGIVRCNNWRDVYSLILEMDSQNK